MPKYSSVTFSAQPVESGGKVSGYVISGFVSRNQLLTLQNLVDSDEYPRSRKWRGEYQEFAKAIVNAIKSVV